MFDVVWGKNANQSSISNAHMKRAVGEEGRLSFYHAVAMLALVCCLYSNSSYAVKDDNIPFNIPQQRADLALTEFAEQANLTLVFPFDQVKDKTANRLVGHYPINTAINLLLQDTGLTPRFSKQLVLHIAIENKGKNMNATNSKKRQTVLAGLVGLFAATGGVGSAMAQGDEAATAQGRIDEIIVTANKREQSLQDTAMSISALTSDTINKRNLTGMGDYLSSIPGVSGLDQGPGFNSIVVRGISGNPQFDGFRGSVLTGVYFGETPLSGLGVSGNSADIKLIDIDRVEVLRGPQGTLYGAGATAGVVRNVPIAPDLDDFGGKINLGNSFTAEEGGNNNSLTGVINIPIMKDTMALRAVGYWLDNSGYYRNIAASDPVSAAAAASFSGVAIDEGNIGADETSGGRLTLLWKPNANLSLNLSYLHQETETFGWGTADVTQPRKYDQTRLRLRDPSTGIVNLNESYGDNLDLANLTIEYDLDWGTVTSSSSWIDENTPRAIGLDGSFGLGAPLSNFTDYVGEAIAQEVRLVSDLEGPIQFIVGYYFEDKDVGQRSVQTYFGGTDLLLNPLSPGSALLISGTESREIKQSAVFGEITFKLTENLQFTAGTRWFDYERDVLQQRFPTAVDGGFFASLNTSESDTLFKAALEWSPSEKSLLYLSWGEGFRFGFVEGASAFPSICDTDDDGEFDAAPGVPVGVRDIGSDFTENYEIGGKFSLLDSRLTVNASIYQINWDGIPQLELYGPGFACFATVNAGEARSRGGEVELAYALSDSFLLTGGISYVDAELTGVSPFGFFSGSEGDSLPGAPEVNANLGVEYNFSISGHEAYWRSDYSYVGGFYNNFSRAGTEIGGYGLLSVNLGIDLNPVTIELYAQNLTNNSSFTWIDLNGLPVERGNRLRPRTFGLSIGYRF